MALAQNQSDKENVPSGRKHGKMGSGGGSFFKRKTARRAKSLGKDHWDDVIFGECHIHSNTGVSLSVD